MPSVDLKLLVGRLNDVCRRTLEAAAGHTLSRTHYNIETEHWLLQLLGQPKCDISLVLQRVGVDPGRLQAELNTALDRMATGNGRAPSLAPELIATAKEAWLFASMVFDDSRLRSGHLLWAMLADEIVGARLCGVAPQLRQIVPDMLRRDFADLTAGSAEAAVERPGEPMGKPTAPAAGGALDRYTVDLTAQARAGGIDPILGRDNEIRQVVDILTRRRQNNPILTGEAGVGKTAVVEGLALRIAAGDVPAPLAQVSLRTLDLGLLQAGAGIKGEFENRLRSVIEETQSSRQPVILFIDEAHMLIGAGSGQGQGDAANLLKPPLARGALRVIAATTGAEYKKYFEKDAALTRRFQVVKVEEPSEATAIDMVRGLLPTLEAHHGVRILDEAAEASVRLSARYIPSRQLPDKAVSLIDTACARVAMSQAATPGAVEDRRRRIDLIDVAARILAREALSGTDHATRLATLDAERAQVGAELQALEARWTDERQLVADLQALRDRVEAAADPAPLQIKLAEVTAALHSLQGQLPLIFPAVDRQAVAEIVEGWTGIPAGRMQTDEIRTVLSLREALSQRVVGQDAALEAVAQAIRTSRAGLTDPRKPIGVFLMVGTSGVGKTETALALAELLYGGEANLTTINMTEFKEEHKVSLLMGSPPGYVGYGEGGVLTEAVRRRPYSVILLDEVEKAHPGVQDVFYQVFDKGTMKDGEGRDVDFRNSVIIMTSNAGSDVIASLFADPETAPAPSELAEMLRPELNKHFKPAFLGRVTVVPYVPLAPATMRRIAELQIDRVARRVQECFGARLEYGPALIDLVTGQATDASTGARGIEAMLTRTLLPDLSAQVLARLADGQTVQRVVVEADGEDRPRCIVY
ncbi:MAG: type secretion system protein VasG [Acetobacteraceae bacterium]|nr:type secretion system protein VasG [Acetobacteraceae bacterium]